MATTVDTFEQLRTQLLNKPFLSGRYGTAWQRVMGRAYDEALNRITQARRARWPDYCPPDGLYWHSVERGLERVSQESETDHRTRLRAAWRIWNRAGSQAIHEDAFGWQGILNVLLLRRVDAAWPPPVGSLYVRTFARMVWSQFDVVIDKPHPWEARIWGVGFWGVGNWGISATTSEVSLIRRLLRQFRSAHNTPTYAVVNLTSGALWGTSTWSATAWGASGSTAVWLVGEEHWAPRGLL